MIVAIQRRQMFFLDTAKPHDIDNFNIVLLLNSLTGFDYHFLSCLAS